MSLLSSVLAWSGVLESLLATIGIAGMGAGSTYTWAGARNGRLGMSRCMPTTSTHRALAQFLAGCGRVTVLRGLCVGGDSLKNVIHLRDTKTTGDFQCLNCSNSKSVTLSYC